MSSPSIPGFQIRGATRARSTWPLRLRVAQALRHGARRRQTQKRIVHAPVAIGVQAHGSRHHRLDLLRQNPELSAPTMIIPECGPAIEEIEAKAQRMVADADDVFLGAEITAAQ